MKKQNLWMNTETGEVLELKAAWAQFAEQYDGGDDCNCITFWDIYKRVEE